MSLSIKGIDISMHNGKINFNDLKNAGIGAVIIKATEGVEYIDPMCDSHTEGVKAAGISFGYYHFMSEKTDPVRQAQDFYNKIKNTGYNILPCLDVETNSKGRSRTEISDRCIEFLNEFKRLSGQDCMIYTGGFFGRDNLDDRVKVYPGWIAHYGVDYPMENGFKVIGHQYTEHGQINGVNGNCDVNNFSESIFIGNAPVVESKPSAPMGNDWVRRLQEECNRQGFSNQIVDGIPGANTLNGCPLVKKGAEGNITRLLQEKLNSLGYGTNGIDGIFGSGTKNAVIQFQKDYGLSADGICGRNTWNKLIYI